MPVLPSRLTSHATQSDRQSDTARKTNGTSSGATVGRRGSLVGLPKPGVHGHGQRPSVQIKPKTSREASRDTSREKPPSKDGAAQRAAGEVAGLKDYVCDGFKLLYGGKRWCMS